MDVSVIKLVVGSLGIVASLSVGGIIYLSAMQIEAPHALSGIASAAIGALVGILASQRTEPRRRDDERDP